MKKVVIIAGSESDRTFVEPALKLAEELKIETEFKIYSAHRNLEELLEYLTELEKVNKTKVIIAVAGLSAALPGVVAAKVKIPVIGVPRDTGPLNGVDALLSIAQMPKGVPVATMAIGSHGMLNAIHFASRILNL
ncbi:MAG: 5-(carboxyamino)imidazole ribonucleotide mutase [Candidatus Melainabacteria bacterium GWF2_37_15]|nr:MAG: 5-(carboxyamino)imidazole ribonucleotide mutase [Candidatus Melainabacteria bacterium GWF2_37_15]